MMFWIHEVFTSGFHGRKSSYKVYITEAEAVAQHKVLGGKIYPVRTY